VLDKIYEERDLVCAIIAFWKHKSANNARPMVTKDLHGDHSPDAVHSPTCP